MLNTYIFKIIDKFGKIIAYHLFKYKKYSKNKTYIELNNSDLKRITENDIVCFSEGIKQNAKYPAGKYVDIKTNADQIFINVVYKNRPYLRNMSITATSGIDVYIRNQEWDWKKTIVPKHNWNMNLVDTINFDDSKSRVLRLYLPPFSELEKMYILINSKFELERINENKNKLIVYGSSISQGCAASRPGLSYVNLLSRLLDYEILNFGFSESARGEKEIINYISKKKGLVYIIEYDHNSSVKELSERHLNIYKSIRKYNNGLIIFISRLSGEISISRDEFNIRSNIIQNTINYAYSCNDSNVCYINGNTLFLENKELLLTDDRHPNDYGMLLIAKAIVKKIKQWEN